MLQSAALKTHLSEVGEVNEDSKPLVVEEVDPAGSDNEEDLDDSNAPDRDTFADEPNEIPSVERRRGGEHQSLDNDDDLALSL